MISDLSVLCVLCPPQLMVQTTENANFEILIIAKKIQARYNFLLYLCVLLCFSWPVPSSSVSRRVATHVDVELQMTLMRSQQERSEAVMQRFGFP